MNERVVYLVKAGEHYLWIGESREEAEKAMAEVFVDGLQIIKAVVKEIKE